MLQFTTQEFDTVMAEIKNREPIYTPEKNILSYKFSQIPQSLDRGTAGEHFLRNKMVKEYGIPAERLGGPGRPDIVFKTSDGTEVRAECKTSLLNATGKYKFLRINPENFDVLFFCYIHPEKFIIVQTIRKVDFLAWTEIGGCKGTPAKKNVDGEYTVTMTDDYKNDKGLDGIIWNEGGWTS